MAKKGHSEEQIVAALKQYESGGKVAEICRKMGISQATFYVWKNQYAGMGVQELRELRQLREENGRLKRLVADLSLDRQILQEIVSKKSSTSSEAPFGGVGKRGVPHLGTQSGPITADAVVDAAVSEPEGEAGTIAKTVAGAGSDARSLWVPAAHGAAAARRLAGKRQAGISAV